MASPLTCQGCGDSWDYDPRLVVACPTCPAQAGRPCQRPSGHGMGTAFMPPHAKRRKLAFEVKPCRCLALWEEAQGHGPLPDDRLPPPNRKLDAHQEVLAL